VLALAGLFAAAFFSATLLPGHSEAALLAFLHFYPEQLWPALGIATLGNTLGGMSSYVIGRLIPEKALQKANPRGLAWVRRYGSLSLLLAWLPVIGDALPLAAGWLRLDPWLSALSMAVGKFARYAAVAALAGHVALR
jgi:membrane protein YqaA with SNARE-associated domain